MLEKLIQSYNEAIFDTDRRRALEVVRQAVADGVAPEDILFKVVVHSLDTMLKSVSEGLDANLAQHFIAAGIAEEATRFLTSQFRQMPPAAGRIVIGTSMGDFHGLGKMIVGACLRAHLIDVADLGLSVPPERFVDEAVARKAKVIGISSMMLHTARGEQGCLAVRRLLRERGIEHAFKIIVGGAPYCFDPDLYQAVQADAWAEDGIKAVPVVSRLIQEVRG